MWVHWLRSPDLMTLRNHLQQYLETEAAERNVLCTVRNFNGRSVRAREVQAVIDEIKYLYEEKGSDK